MFNLDGRKALITGAGQGMGLGIAKALKDAGAEVYINDLYKDRAEFAANKVGATAISGDITDANIRESFLEITKGVDILINNAGVPVEMPTSLNQADMLQENDYQRQLDLNFN
jgi:2-hydroxycyclohexanecarboxyl-CoA dehydrogenase